MLAHKRKINRKETKHQMPKTKENRKTSLDVEEVEEEVDDHRSMNSLVAHRDSGHHIKDE